MIGLLIGASWVDGKLMIGLLSPFFTVSFMEELRLPEVHMISPSSSISSLLKTSWCLPPPRFLISTLKNTARSIRRGLRDALVLGWALVILKCYLSDDSIDFPLKVHSAGAVWSWSSISKTSFSLSTAVVSFSFLLNLFISGMEQFVSDVV